MLTIFSTAKPFRGHVEITQRNAIRSWILLRPDCEVILFGDEPGAYEVAAESGIRHLPNVSHSEYGSTRLDYVFSSAQKIARHDLLCYANCDIIFFPSLLEAVSRVARWSPEFLMVGRRWNTPVTGPLDFTKTDWEARLRDFAMRSGKLQPPDAVDYFVFPRGLYREIPPFVVARTHWDHWMIWRARSTGVPVVDASADVLAIHQDHDYAYHSGGLRGVKTDFESRRNRKLAGGQMHLYTIDHATHRLVDGRIEDTPGRWHMPASFFVRTYSSQVWYWILKTSFKARHALGLHRGALAQAQRRVRSILGD